MNSDSTSSHLCRKLVWVGVSAALVALVAPAPYRFSQYGLDLLSAGLIFALFTLSWDMFSGTTGETSFGHSLFIGVGAYSLAIAQGHLGCGPWLSLLTGVVVGGAVGALMGLVTIRHSGAFFAVATMVVQFVFYRSLFLHSGLLGGDEGLLVSRPLFRNSALEYAAIASISIACLLAGVVLRQTGLGRSLRACGGDYRVALACGVRIVRVRVLGSSLAGMVAALGGSLMAMHHGVAHQELAGDTLSILVFLLATLGGWGTLIGPWLAGLAYVALFREVLAQFGAAEPLLLSGVMLVLIWVTPQGSWVSRWGRELGKRIKPTGANRLNEKA